MLTSAIFDQNLDVLNSQQNFQHMNTQKVIVTKVYTLAKSLKSHSSTIIFICREVNWLNANPNLEVFFRTAKDINFSKISISVMQQPVKINSSIPPLATKVATNNSQSTSERLSLLDTILTKVSSNLLSVFFFFFLRVFTDKEGH